MAADVHPGRRVTPALGTLAVGGAGLALVGLLPHLLGITWPAVADEISDVPLVVLAGLLGLWLAGLVVHAPVLMAALPGLRLRQALVLNLAGSAVSNVVPAGGAAGMGLGLAIARSWGFTTDAFTSFTVASNLWNVAGRFAVGAGVLGAAAVCDVALPAAIGPVLVSAAVFLALAGGLSVVTFASARTAAAVGGVLDRLHRVVRPAAVPGAIGAWLVLSRAALVGVLRGGWKVMTAGVLAYVGLQAALLAACLAAVGAGAPPGAVAVAFALERLISLAPVTPGAAGVAELGTVAALHFFGVDAVSAASGVLLYRTLVFALEIPVGGVLVLGWLRRVRRAPSPVTAEVTP